MDADTRHELKQNELASALSKLQTVDAKKWLKGIGVVVVLAAAVVGYRVWTGMRESAVEHAWSELVLINPEQPKDGEDPIAKLRDLIKQNDEAPFQAAARLKLASALMTQAIKDDVKHDELAREANDLLAGIPRGKIVTGFAAATDLLQAQIHEALRETDKARALYESIQKNPAYEGYPQPALAEMLLATLDKQRGNLNFLPGTKPLPAPATQAAGQPALPKSLTEAMQQAGVTPIPVTPPAPAATSGEQPVTPAEPAPATPTTPEGASPAPSSPAPATPAPTPAAPPAAPAPATQPNGGAPATP